jgi:hypothetical protein
MPEPCRASRYGLRQGVYSPECRLPAMYKMTFSYEASPATNPELDGSDDHQVPPQGSPVLGVPWGSGVLLQAGRRAGKRDLSSDGWVKETLVSPVHQSREG